MLLAMLIQCKFLVTIVWAVGLNMLFQSLMFSIICCEQTKGKIWFHNQYWRFSTILQWTVSHILVLCYTFESCVNNSWHFKIQNLILHFTWNVQKNVNNCFVECADWLYQNSGSCTTAWHAVVVYTMALWQCVVHVIIL